MITPKMRALLDEPTVYTNVIRYGYVAGEWSIVAEPVETDKKVRSRGRQNQQPTEGNEHGDA